MKNFIRSCKTPGSAMLKYSRLLRTCKDRVVCGLLKHTSRIIETECIAVAAIPPPIRLQTRMRKRIPTRPKKPLANFSHQISNQKVANLVLCSNSPATANGFANELTKLSLSLRKLLANGCLRQSSLAIANATTPNSAPNRPRNLQQCGNHSRGNLNGSRYMATDE